MGIYDRDYYRDESGGWWSTMSGHPATWSIVGVTVSLFLLQILTRFPAGGGWPPDLISRWLAFEMDAVASGQIWRLITAHFVHTPYSLIGVGFGMLALYWFGCSVEDVYGPREFLAFYLMTGLLIGISEVAIGLIAAPPNLVYFGSGGCLVAVLVLYACHYPHQKIYIFFVLPVPAWILACVIVVLNLVFFSAGSLNPVPTLVAASFAFVYHRQSWRILRWVPAMASRQRKTRLKPYVPAAEDDTPARVGAPVQSAPRTAPEPRPANVDEQLEAKLDHVLEKVSRFGRESLTAEEREILHRASEVYRRRRGRES